MYYRKYIDEDPEVPVTYLLGTVASSLSNYGTKTIISALASLIGVIVGPWNPVYTAAIILLLADQVTGTVSSITRGEFSATVLGKKTAFKIIIYGIAFIMAHQIAQIGYNTEGSRLRDLFEFHRLLVNFVATWIAITEWESVGKNIRSIGGRWPSIASLVALGFKIKKILKGK